MIIFFMDKPPIKTLSQVPSNTLSPRGTYLRSPVPCRRHIQLHALAGMRALQCARSFRQAVSDHVDQKEHIFCSAVPDVPGCLTKV